MMWEVRRSEVAADVGATDALKCPVVGGLVDGATTGR